MRLRYNADLAMMLWKISFLIGVCLCCQRDPLEMSTTNILRVDVPSSETGFGVGIARSIGGTGGLTVNPNDDPSSVNERRVRRIMAGYTGQTPYFDFGATSILALHCICVTMFNVCVCSLYLAC